MKIPVSDFLEETKSELFCYEELEEEKILLWEEKFKELIENGTVYPFKLDKKKENINLTDESEIFALADGYLDAVLSGEEEKYWLAFEKK